MSKRNLFFAMVVSSMMGGVIAIAGYSVLVDDGTAVQVVPTSSTNPVSFTNYTLDTSEYVVPEGLNFVYAAKNSTASVVHIRTRFEASSRSNTVFDDFFREYFGETPDRRRSPGQGTGSGVIVSDEGYIVTNNHVIDGAYEIEVLLNDNRSLEAEIIGTDPTTDLAVIKIDAEDIQPMNWGNSDALQLGEWVLAVGNPFEFKSTVTAGIVSAKARNIGILQQRSNMQIESFIQTDAAVNPGNSGGALVNLKGQLVGINTAIISPTGAFAGYSFAVPVSLVQKVYQDLVEHGEVQRALLGINIRDVNAQVAEQFELDVLRGVYVVDVRGNSAAEEAGLENGDVIIGIDGEPVYSTSELQEKVALNRPGDRVRVTYLREGKQYETDAVLKNTMGTTALVAASQGFSISGGEFIEVSDEELQELDLEGGVKAAEINSGKWREAGIKPGFIITRVDKQEIRSLDDFSSYLDYARGEGILLEGIYPDGEKAYYGIGW